MEYNSILDSHRSEGIAVMCSNMDEFVKHAADRRKSGGRRYIQHGSIRVNFKVGKKRTDTLLGMHT